MTKDEKNAAQIKGSRNLVLLGIIATIVALITTGISLAIYHNSGDIYLDRSRPGFLPDEEEIESEDVEEEEYNFSKVEKLNAEALEEYQKNLSTVTKSIDEYSDSFNASALTDDSLGITE
jgi:hypothetical protein